MAMSNDTTTYKIIRFCFDQNHPDHKKVIRTGLTLEEAQAHCQDESTHEEGAWFDGYDEEDPSEATKQERVAKDAALLDGMNRIEALIARGRR